MSDTATPQTAEQKFTPREQLKILEDGQKSDFWLIVTEQLGKLHAASLRNLMSATSADDALRMTTTYAACDYHMHLPEILCNQLRDYIKIEENDKAEGKANKKLRAVPPTDGR